MIFKEDVGATANKAASLVFRLMTDLGTGCNYMIGENKKTHFTPEIGNKERLKTHSKQDRCELNCWHRLRVLVKGSSRFELCTFSLVLTAERCDCGTIIKLSESLCNARCRDINVEIDRVVIAMRRIIISDCVSC
jgi:hypothetical protein